MSITFETTKILFFKYLQIAISSGLADSLLLVIAALIVCIIINSMLAIISGVWAHIYCNISRSLVPIMYAQDPNTIKDEYRATRQVALQGLFEAIKKSVINKEGIGSNAVGIVPDELAVLAQTSSERAKMVIAHLKKVGLVKIVNDGEQTVAIPTISADHLSLYEFLERIEMRNGIPSDLKNTSALDWFWLEYTTALKLKFQNITLMDLVNRDVKKHDDEVPELPDQDIA
ncbi:MAG: hypothetical protein HQK50_19110 [Oligoflexia bacterium]|nr:hypothetical protein [Oligoflexia bacterium]